MNITLIEYCGANTSGVPETKKIEITKPDFDTAIRAAKSLVSTDPDAKFYTFISVANNANSNQPFDVYNEFGTLKIDDILGGVK